MTQSFQPTCELLTEYQVVQLTLHDVQMRDDGLKPILGILCSSTTITNTITATTRVSSYV